MKCDKDGWEKNNGAQGKQQAQENGKIVEGLKTNLMKYDSMWRLLKGVLNS